MLPSFHRFWEDRRRGLYGEMVWLFAGWRRWLNRNFAPSNAGLGNDRASVACVIGKIKEEAIGNRCRIFRTFFPECLRC